MNMNNSNNSEFFDENKLFCRLNNNQHACWLLNVLLLKRTISVSLVCHANKCQKQCICVCTVLYVERCLVTGQ